MTNHQPTLFEREEPAVPIEPKDDSALWFGLVINHRKLFEALEYDYLHPRMIGTIFLGVNCYVDHAIKSDIQNLIPIYIKIDPRLLPSLISDSISSIDLGETRCLTQSNSDYASVSWISLLPVSSFVELAVQKEEHLIRLLGLTTVASNLRMPIKPIVRGLDTFEIIYAEQASKLTLSVFNNEIWPSETTLDSYRGSICMALWGIPKLKPWVDGLFESLLPKESATFIDKSSLPKWFRNLPWAPHAEKVSNPSGDIEGALWDTSIRLLVDACGSESFNSREFISECFKRISISSAAHPPDFHQKLSAWRNQTDELLSGHIKFRPDNRLMPEIGLSLQLLLLRPRPEEFKTWIIDYPELPPTVWVAGVILCGLLNGYHRLSLDFRGVENSTHNIQQGGFNNALLLHLLHNITNVLWPGCPQSQPQATLEGDRLFLTWDKHFIGAKRTSERMAWYLADLANPDVHNNAKSLAITLGWPCIVNTITLPPGTYACKGSVTLVEPGEGLDAELKVHDGELTLITQSGIASIKENLDPDLFKRCLLLEGGDLRKPELRDLTPHLPKISSNLYISHVNKAPSIALDKEDNDKVPGLALVKNFITHYEERHILECIDTSSWNNVADADSRRVQHYGWRYNYLAKSVSRKDMLGRLPSWAEELAIRLMASGLMSYKADQVIVNEYTTGQGISLHTDCIPCFEDTIVSISLLESWTMNFRCRTDRLLKPSLLLPRLSALVMTGDARFSWQHSIAKRKKDESGQPRIRRVSLTFRKVVPNS
jgi:alkylated DNA repair dioxygenase AlkB